MGEKPVPIHARDVDWQPSTDHEAYWWPGGAPLRRLVVSAGSFRRLEGLPVPDVGDADLDVDVILHLGDAVTVLDLVSRERVALRRAFCGLPGCDCLALQWFVPGRVDLPEPDPFWLPIPPEDEEVPGCPCGCVPPWEVPG